MEQIQNENEKFLDPVAILGQLDVQAGSIVADFGCGPGFFTIPFAKAVDVSGKVFALDVLTSALEVVASKAKNAGVANIVPMRVNVEKENGSKLSPNCADWVVMKDMLFQNQKKNLIINEAKRILKSDGKVLVIEWNQTGTMGPEKELRIAKDDLKKMFADSGLEIEKDINAGDFHYGFVCKKK